VELTGKLQRLCAGRSTRDDVEPLRTQKTCGRGEEGFAVVNDEASQSHTTEPSRNGMGPQ